MGILNTLSKNPTLIGFGVLAITLFIFRDRISGFFSDITGGVKGAAGIGETVGILNENFQGFLTGIQDLASGKTFEDFKFPEFKFPEFKFPDFFAGAEVVGTDIDKALAAGATVEEISAMIPIDPTDPNQDPTKFLPPMDPALADEPSDAELFAKDFPEPFIAVQPTIPPTSQLNLGQEQPFTEAPLGALSLSAIIDKFMVTASQAANIKFISQQGGDPFADPSNIFGENPPAVSDPTLAGLSPEEIFASLFGSVQNPNF